MTASQPAKQGRDTGLSPENEMTKYGITRVPVDYFHYNGFRYTNLQDALAQAKRHGHGRDLPAAETDDSGTD